ncbi:MAG: RNA polymerase sigma-70 factor (ECF subfamily) [Planctomycetota bacterium]|jgi:RNA polymerase sigma-70 factor (ECF subfamily)
MDPSPSESSQESEESVNMAADAGYVESSMSIESTQLMCAVQAGDPQAFETLAHSLRSRAFQIAHSLVGSRDDALDMCQETFLKVFKARDSYDSNQPFLPWFHRILRNTCFSFLRKHRRIRKISLSVQNKDGEESDFEITDPGPAPDAGTLAEERSMLFRKALSTLSSRDREILALRHFDELAYKQIAESLGIPEGTVMSRLYHARRRLRDALGPHLQEEAAVLAAKIPSTKVGEERAR